MIDLNYENNLLDEKFRAQIIKEISGPENIARKNKSLKAHEIYKDKTKKWVVKALEQEFGSNTVKQMKNRASNISILKKVVNKLAQAYLGGVSRYGKTEAETKSIEDIAYLTNLNERMKKADRYLHLHKNCLIHCVPILNREESIDKEVYDLQIKIFPPHLYDVITDPANPEKAIAIVLTQFTEAELYDSGAITAANGRVVPSLSDFMDGDGVNQAIANSPADAGRDNREYIFWSNKFHFTCSSDGKLTNKSPDDLANPIEMFPCEFVHADQSESFWAPGGDDLVDGAIMINIELTDLYTIKNVQGWGQPVISGNIQDKTIKGGPHNAIYLSYEEGDPKSEFYYASSNPPLDQHMKSIEMTTALYLSTNNLSPTNVAGKLDAASFPSGIAKMVEQSESSEPVEQSQQYFKTIEPQVLNILAAWARFLGDKKQLSSKWNGVSVLEKYEPTIEFYRVKQPITEKEKLENLKIRKELGINTIEDLIKLDNPDLTDEEIAAKMLELASKEPANKDAANKNESQVQDENSQEDDTTA